MNAPFALRQRGCPAGVHPRRWREALAARIQWHQLVVERLVQALDAMDGDCDFEPDGTEEPSLGWPTIGQQQFGHHPERLDDDREVDNADFEDGGDHEPNLGAPEIRPDYCVPGGQYGWHVEPGTQERWAAGSRDEREGEQGDDEPSMGWSERDGQGGWVGVDLPAGSYAGDNDA